ncbi:sulfatase [Ideonella livida]|uniref:Sulfatase n=1 Tax=Ideonella livida TaxID=2707176 RepID=A0A7C9PGA1_9BURK|nr:sulfatase [Ideonella livida]NDY91008.1 sulfatase [Ideonella livida]
MQRRELLQLALGAALTGCGSGSGQLTPNILNIALDDLNDWVGFLGHPQAKTPHMDALAASAFNFRRAYCTVPVCSASRASVLSGLSPQSTGVYDLSATFKSKNPGKLQFDQMLAGAGYQVQRHGKIDHEWAGALSQPVPVSRPYHNKQCPAVHGSTDLDFQGAFDWGPAPGLESGQPDYILAQRGIDFLKAQAVGRPFCLSVGLYRNHVAWYTPQRFIDLYPLDQLILPTVPADELEDLGPEAKAFALKWKFHECIVRQDLWASAVQGYLATISWVDEQIGRLIAALEASPHAANTIVVLWSDHGFHLGEKFHWHKLALWEHATRVPFLIRLPGQRLGRAIDSCVSLADLAPTLMSQCGVKPTYAMDGRDLTPLMTQADLSWSEPVVTTLDQHNFAVRDSRWRYIRYARGEQELYDEQADPGEHRNLAGDPAYAGVIAELARHLPT